MTLSILQCSKFDSMCLKSWMVKIPDSSHGTALATSQRYVPTPTANMTLRQTDRLVLRPFQRTTILVAGRDEASTYET